MEVDFFAPVELIRQALPLLLEGRQPIIVNMGSVLGHRAVPDKSEYCAAKFALHGFSDALRAELQPTGIDVLLVSPSTTRTEFFDNVLESNSSRKEGAFGASSPQRVSRSTIRAIRCGKHEVILSLGGKLLVWFDRLFPTLANRILAR
jgi:short-subunit dehydrogenase